jgi:hypothetical protein
MKTKIPKSKKTSILGLIPEDDFSVAVTTLSYIIVIMFMGLFIIYLLCYLMTNL